jgi:hypothetical protein
MISQHASPNLFAAYLAFVDAERESPAGCLTEATLLDLQRTDFLWQVLLEKGELQAFFSEDTRTTTENGGYLYDIDYPAIHFFLWRFKRDGCRDERWHNFRESWRNYKAMGLDKVFEEDLCASRKRKSR